MLVKQVADVRRRHLAIGGLIAAVGALAGCGPDRAPVSASIAARPAGEVARSVEAATPTVTVAPDVGGAVELAVRYVASTDQLMAHSSIGRREILKQLVAPSVVDSQLAAIDAVAAQVDERLGQSATELLWVEAPLATSIESSTGSEVTVAVWTVSVFAHPEASLPQQLWRTIHVTIGMIDGRWWVTGATSDAGPTPDANELSLPSTVEEFVPVAGWQPVVAGVEL